MTPDVVETGLPSQAECVPAILPSLLRTPRTTDTQFRDDVIAHVSHELRTPLNAILGMTELLLDTSLKNDQRQSLLAIKSTADSLLRITNDLLDYSCTQAGKIELAKIPFSLREVAECTFHSLANSLRSNNIELICNIDPRLPSRVIGDPGRIRQVLTNLIGNAIKFTEVGEIVVRVDVEDVTDNHCKILFSVSDTGIGISQEEHEQIFRPFSQATRNAKYRNSGTGLGLYISSQIINSMDSQIRVESVPGKGSLFSFTLQLPLLIQTLAEPASPPQFYLSGSHALVVTENLSNRQLLGRLLSHHNITPRLASNIAEASNAIEMSDTSSPISFILIDDHQLSNHLPFITALQEKWQRSPPEIISLTSSNSHSLDFPVDATITKPIRQNDLFDVLSVLGQKIQAEKQTRLHPPVSKAILDLDAPLRILIAEDNEYNSAMFGRLLTTFGHHCSFADNGSSALTMAMTGNFDLMLLDVCMPLMDGIQVVTHLRAHELTTGCHLPVIGITARTRPEERDQCLAAGMDDWLPKPSTITDLYRAIECLIMKSCLDSTEHVEFDHDRFLEYCGNDLAISYSLREAFEKHLQHCLDAVKQASRDEDLLRLKHLAQTMSDIFSNFSPTGSRLTNKLANTAAAHDGSSCRRLIWKLNELCLNITEQIRQLSSQTLPDAVAR